jgi:hypothetical protein
MSRRRLLLLAVAVPLALALAAAGLLVYGNRVGTPSLVNFGRIHHGMPLASVEQLFGGPGAAVPVARGVYAAGLFRAEVAPGYAIVYTPRPGREGGADWRAWHRGEAPYFVVVFDGAGTVVDSFRVDDEPLGFLDRLILGPW